MPETNMETQATIVYQRLFFTQAGSCEDGQKDRINLLGYIIDIMLINNKIQDQPDKNIIQKCY